MSSLSRSEKKRERLAALEKKVAKKKPSEPVSVEEPKGRHAAVDLSGGGQQHDAMRETKKRKKKEKIKSNSNDAMKKTAMVDEKQTAADANVKVYASFDKASDIYPWTEGDGRTLDDVVQELLLTNPKYKVGRGDVAEKMKEKTLMLDNPDVRRTARMRGRFLKNAGVAKATRKELCALGAVDVSRMSISYDDARALHQMWKEYRDSLMESCATRRDVEAAVSSMDKHGADIVVTKASEERYIGLRGIIVGDSRTVLHVIEASDGRNVMVPRRATEYAFEISQGRRVTIST